MIIKEIIFNMSKKIVFYAIDCDILVEKISENRYSLYFMNRDNTASESITLSLKATISTITNNNPNEYLILEI